MNAATLVQRVWNYCHTLRDDGVGYGDYLEQLTYLLFLKMTHEFSEPPYNRDAKVPEEFNWVSLRTRTGELLELHYARTLKKLGSLDGMLGAIFFKAENKIPDPAKLARIIKMIDGEKWIGLSIDTKGELYEGLLQKNAEDTKSGAGQYFTPRPIIDAVVACIQPKPKKTIADPACGTGGFFLSSGDWITYGDPDWLEKEMRHWHPTKHNPSESPASKLDKSQAAFLRDETFTGNEIVPSTRRLCLMNLFLHNIGNIDGEPGVERADALLNKPSQLVDYVLANPPFGKKSSITITNADGEEDKDNLTYERPDFWATTTNKQLNFLQHIVAMLKETGQAAVVLPDNVLFEGGVGERIRRKWLETCDVHTILRLPTGIFYANGVKANVVFFDKAPADGKTHTKGIWYYDLRTNKHFTLKQRPMVFGDLVDFIRCYNPSNRFERRETKHFKYYDFKALEARDKFNLDIFWLKDDSLDNIDNLPPPDVLQQEIIEHLEAALASFRDVATTLASSSK
ncbi:HsdM family class I SAM-dependent methyltransferase [Photorhabdus khanii]|uniref:site-specific DNA-methyltransferase (adenine-specific) n=1 Tax=Photorhabdus khanii subsp. guanajuatensis TaxID=2100166 RepID=A0A4V2X5J4_9GAMM|nr:class I SAM-dependent DNA methyltransferase [Photorhabdus khanii]TDB48385.1 DNA methyltransferase [Photorhabdus khanii subsp. guanajuatensis]